MIEVYPFLASRKTALDELLGPSEWVDSIAINWSCVEAVKTYLPDEDDIENGIDQNECTLVYLKSGESFVIRMTFDKAVELFKKHSTIWA